MYCAILPARIGGRLWNCWPGASFFCGWISIEGSISGDKAAGNVREIYPYIYPYGKIRQGTLWNRTSEKVLDFCGSRTIKYSKEQAVHNSNPSPATTWKSPKTLRFRGFFIFSRMYLPLHLPLLAGKRLFLAGHYLSEQPLFFIC